MPLHKSSQLLLPMMNHNFFICLDNESLARIGATCFLQLVMTNGPKFNEDMWTAVCTSLSQILEKNTPRELLTNADEATNGENAHATATPGTTETPRSSMDSNGKASPRDSHGEDHHPAAPKKQTIPSLNSKQQTSGVYKAIKGKCTVQLGLVEAMNEIAFTHYPNLSTSHLKLLVESFENCFQFYHDVNNNPLWKTKLAKTGNNIIGLMPMMYAQSLMHAA
jgi:brefeldin A-inhibited guanine nucleotide-exchange protein